MLLKDVYFINLPNQLIFDIMKSFYSISFFTLTIGLISCLVYLKTDVKKNTGLITSTPTEYTGEETHQINTLALENVSQVTFLNDTLITTANGKITGHWSTKYLTKKGLNKDGHRVKYSVYNPISKVFYAVSNSGSLYKITPENKNQWELVNNKVPIYHWRNGYRRIYPLAGLVTPQNTFRLVLQGAIGNNMYYSDDEGRSWVAASGLDNSNLISYETLVNYDSNKSQIVAFGGQSDNNFKGYKIYISSDNGLTYTPSLLNKIWPFASHEVRVAQSLRSNTIFAIVRNSNNETSLYELNLNKSDFELVKTFTNPITKITNFKVSYDDNNHHHFYVRENEKLHYAKDTDNQWSLKNNDIKVNTESGVYMAAVHPSDPSTIYYGFTDLYISSDNGATTTKTNHGLDKFHFWDVENFQFHKKLDNSTVAFIGTHFGCFFNEEVKNIKAWQTASNGCPVIMPYDATYSEKHNVGFTANQDKGTTQYFDGNSQSNQLETTSVIGGDCFRVALSNDENSLWYTKLGGTLFLESFNADHFPVGRRQIQHGFPTGFWGSNLIISPDLEENAVYLTGNNNLKKFTHNNNIVASNHAYTFPEKTQGFGYSKLNRNNWYVSDAANNFYYSTDGGVSFNLTDYTGNKPQSTEAKTKKQHKIMADVIDPNKVYFAGISNNFLISENNGKNFTNHNRGLTVNIIYGLDMSPDGKYIFAACGIDGPWVYDVEGDIWYPIEGDAIDAKAAFYTVQYLKTRNSVRFTSYGGDISDFVIDQNFNPWIRVESENEDYFNFDNNWSLYTYPNGNKVHFTNNANSELNIKFQGEKIRLYAMNRSDLGILDIYIDGRKISTIDTYSSQLRLNQMIFESAVLTNGNHSLKVVATGQKNAQSSGIEIVIDGIEVQQRNKKENGYQKLQNLAPLATTSASSEFNSKYVATNATDNTTFDGRGSLEWASRSSIDNAPYLELKWNQNIVVEKIVLFDRANQNANILSSKITFNNGESIDVPALPYWGTPLVIDIDNKTINSLKFEVINSQGDNVGLKEIMVFGELAEENDDNLAPYASVNSTGLNQDNLNTLNDSNTSNLWTSNLEETSRITLTWNTEIAISGVQLYENQNNASLPDGKLIFDNGNYADVRAFGTKNELNFTKLKFNDIVSRSLTYEVSHSEAKRINLSEIKVFGVPQGDLENITLNVADNRPTSNFVSNVKVYPNPTSDILNINTNTPDASTATLYDLSGRLLANQNFTSNHTLNLSRYATNTILILKIKTGNKISTHKIGIK